MRLVLIIIFAMIQNDCGCEEGFIKTRKLQHALPWSLLVCLHCKVFSMFDDIIQLR